MLFNQFKFFFNLFFLLICLSQFIPALKVGKFLKIYIQLLDKLLNFEEINNAILGFMFTYIAPLAFVLFVTLLKEAADDL